MRTAKNSQQGFVISFITFSAVVIALAIAVAMSSVTFYRQRQSTAQLASTRAYYAAEAGLEDAILQLKSNPNLSATSYDLSVGDAVSSVTIPALVGGSRTVTAQGSDNASIRTLEATYGVDGTSAQFHYGVQVGAGGVHMNNGSEIIGNVFSDGPVSGSGTIDDDIITAGAAGLSGVAVGGNANTYSCSGATISGNLTYNQSGSNACTVQGTAGTQSDETPSASLPISQSQIDSWKAEGAAGNTISGDYSLNNGQTASLGPAEITGNLSLDNNSVLTVTGTLYVLGNVSIGNGSTVALASDFGGSGGVVVSDGQISIANGAITQGSGQSGSYLLLLSISASGSAISISNNGQSSIFYAENGGITLANNASAQEITGYQLNLSNNTTVTYSTGLANTTFSSGPSGGWKVSDWQEK